MDWLFVVGDLIGDIFTFPKSWSYQRSTEQGNITVYTISKVLTEEASLIENFRLVDFHTPATTRSVTPCFHTISPYTRFTQQAHTLSTFQPAKKEHKFSDLHSRASSWCIWWWSYHCGSHVLLIVLAQFTREQFILVQYHWHSNGLDFGCRWRLDLKSGQSFKHYW